MISTLSAELPVLWFSTKLGYFKILSMEKLACNNAHSFSLVLGDW